MYVVTMYPERKRSKNNATREKVVTRTFEHESEAKAALDTWRESFPKKVRWRLRGFVAHSSAVFDSAAALAYVQRRLGARHAYDAESIVSEAWLCHRNKGYCTIVATRRALRNYFRDIRREGIRARMALNSGLFHVVCQETTQVYKRSEPATLCDMPERFAKLVSLLRAGYTQSEVAKQLGVQQAAVSKLCAKLRKYLASEPATHSYTCKPRPEHTRATHSEPRPELSSEVEKLTVTERESIKDKLTDMGLWEAYYLTSEDMRRMPAKDNAYRV